MSAKMQLKCFPRFVSRKKILAIMDRGYYGLKVFEHGNRIPHLSSLIRILNDMTKEIAALPDKNLDLDLNSARTLKSLYEKRWKIELAFRDIKHALGALPFHSKKDLFNLQIFFAHLIRYNLTSRIIRQVCLAKTKNLKYHCEIIFKNVAQVVQNHCRRTTNYKKILEQIKHYLHPLRDNRLFQ